MLLLLLLLLIEKKKENGKMRSDQNTHLHFYCISVYYTSTLLQNQKWAAFLPILASSLPIFRTEQYFEQSSISIRMITADNDRRSAVDEVQHLTGNTPTVSSGKA